MKKYEDAVMIAVLEKVNENIGNAPCPLCAQSDWELSNRFTTVPTSKSAYDEDLFLERHKIFPFAMLVCQNCGNTHFIDMKTLGIFDDSGRLKSESLEEKDNENAGKEEIESLKETINKMSEDQAALKESLDDLLNAKSSRAFFSFEKKDKK